MIMNTKVFLLLSLSALLLLVDGISSGIQDKISFHHSESIFAELGDWWNPEVSHTLKYKNRDINQGPKFFLSTTLLVWTTDAWHFFKSLGRMATVIAALLFAAAIDRLNIFPKRWWYYLVAYIIFWGFFQIGFLLFWQWL